MESRDQRHGHLWQRVTNGSSIQGRTAKDLSNKTRGILDARTCAIEIRNHHRHLELVSPNYYTYSGTSVIPPPSIISPGYAEMMLFRKTSGSLWGTSGVLTYKVRHVKDDGPIEYDDTTMAFMWSVGTVGVSCHAIGVSMEKALNTDRTLYSQLLNGQSCWFVRGRPGFGVSLEDLDLYGTPVNVYGSLSQGGRAVWNINIK